MSKVVRFREVLKYHKSALWCIGVKDVPDYIDFYSLQTTGNALRVSYLIDADMSTPKCLLNENIYILGALEPAEILIRYKVPEKWQADFRKLTSKTSEVFSAEFMEIVKMLKDYEYVEDDDDGDDMPALEEIKDVETKDVETKVEEKVEEKKEEKVEETKVETKIEEIIWREMEAEEKDVEKK
jgi:hypothetical protein